ncbi:MAG: HAF repeat-containing protein, partial [Isosphaeraceae bacterium]
MRSGHAPWFLASALVFAQSASADEPVGPLRVVTPKGVGIIATALNGRGDLVGFEWVEDPNAPGVVEQKPFHARGKAITYLPLLEGYTSTFPAALSDDGLVVGRASKAAPFNTPVRLRNQAIVWDQDRGIRALGTLEGDAASFATGVSRDGKRISGFSVGATGSRACVWDRSPDGDVWKATLLPHETGLGSNVVALSGNGRHASAVDGAVPCLWTFGEDGRWTRETLSASASLIPRAVNDSGMVVGFRDTGDGSKRAVIWTRESGCQSIEPPKGYVTAEALAVNSAGLVVGYVDGPNGSPIGPNAFAYQEGRLRIITEG